MVARSSSLLAPRTVTSGHGQDGPLEVSGLAPRTDRIVEAAGGRGCRKMRRHRNAPRASDDEEAPLPDGGIRCRKYAVPQLSWMGGPTVGLGADVAPVTLGARPGHGWTDVSASDRQLSVAEHE